MTPQEVVAAAQGALQEMGRVLLELTAVLVLSYLLFFFGSLVVAALRHAKRKDTRDRRVSQARTAPATIPALATQNLSARTRSMASIDRPA